MTNTPKPGWYGFNPHERDVKYSPHEMLRELREQAPVNLTPEGRWRLSRYQDIQKLLKNSSVGMRDLNGCIPDHSREESDASKFMLRMDPPDHDRIRGLVSKAFTPRALAAIEPQVRTMVDAELAKTVPTGTIDFATDLALLVPAASMCAMLGVPLEDRDKLSTLVSQSTYMLAVKAYPNLLPMASQAIEQLYVYMMQLIDERRKNPGDDILSALVMAEEAGDKLSDEELIQQAIGLLIAGLETTMGVIGNGMRCFAQHPEQFELLAAQPDLVESAVEECMRYEPSIPFTIRVMWEDTEFDGITIPANGVVQAMLITANRDPEMFSNPDTFDITRKKAKHCSFGGGIHFCLGSHLARMNAAVAFSSMADRITNIELDDDGFEWAPSLFRIPGKIPARFDLRD